VNFSKEECCDLNHLLCDQRTVSRGVGARRSFGLHLPSGSRSWPVFQENARWRLIRQTGGVRTRMPGVWEGQHREMPPIPIEGSSLLRDPWRKRGRVRTRFQLPLPCLRTIHGKRKREVPQIGCSEKHQKALSCSIGKRPVSGVWNCRLEPPRFGRAGVAFCSSRRRWLWQM
jgi:hypothetical protein